MLRQHYRYYKEVKKIPNPKPIELFGKYLFDKIVKWRSAGEEVLLGIDANEHIYRSKFAQKLAEIGVELSSAYTRVHNKEMPASHSRGSKPIIAFLATPGVDCKAYFIGRFKLGVGNYRGPHVLDIPIASLLGTDKICPQLLEGRKLQVIDVSRCRKKYNANFKHMTANHKMKIRMKMIVKKVNKLSV